MAESSAPDYIELQFLGDAIQQGLTQDDYSVTGAMIVITTIAAIQVSVSWFAFRFKRVRHFLEGEPLVLVQDGELLNDNLRRARLAPEELAEEARISQVASLSDVAWAILEPSGKISFIPKSS